MGNKPDTELFNLVNRFQNGDQSAGWLFIQNKKINAIIKSRLNFYSIQYPWLSSEDIIDIECGLWPALINVLGKFKLPEQPNDGRVISYFNVRIKGEGDYLLKKITNMKQATDPETGKTYLRSLNQSIEGFDEIIPSGQDVTNEVVDSIECERQDNILFEILDNLPDWSTDRIWFRCYMLRLKKHKWDDIARAIGYKQTDYTWLKENTSRFITRLKHRLVLMGEDVNYKICGIYTADDIVAISIYDSERDTTQSVWSKTYDSYEQLDKIESKLGDIFRASHISYIIMNEEQNLSRAHAIIMRYLTKRESFVETIEIRPFMKWINSISDSVGKTKCSDVHKMATLLTHIKKACLDEIASRKRPAI